ncbi:hypothetical protein TNCT_77851 [Trichonephila clavata]|uniref:Uncharacterized protein n=1 Tax=Trichonephila clavata TaxID=2740835 RepID=A0A8X6JG96_TRICU|nr:hypothetical protein TNCT_77851 [Trichonephila clavata]
MEEESTLKNRYYKIVKLTTFPNPPPIEAEKGGGGEGKNQTIDLSQNERERKSRYSIVRERALGVDPYTLQLQLLPHKRRWTRRNVPERNCRGKMPRTTPLLRYRKILLSAEQPQLFHVCRKTRMNLYKEFKIFY